MQVQYDQLSLASQSTPAFQDPLSDPPTLGTADTDAPSGHGGAEPNLLTEIYEAPGNVADRARDLYDNAADRIASWSGAGAVVEHSDASSWLVAPNAAKTEIENMRWSAGPILGGVDWLIEQLTGVSLLEDVIMKPFAGDWTGIEEVQQAWLHVGEAMRAVSDNGAGLAESGAFWVGHAGTAYQGGMAAIGLSAIGLATVADAVAGLVGQLVLVSKTAAATIGFSVIRLIYSIINIIFDVIESVIAARAQLVETLFRMEDLVQVLAQTARKYV